MAQGYWEARQVRDVFIANRERVTDKGKREGLKAVGIGALGLAADHVMRRLGIKGKTQAALTATIYNEDPVPPGIPEQIDTDEFFTSNGHLDWVERLCQQAIPNEIDRMMLTKMDETPEDFRRMGQTFWKFLNTASYVLNKSYGEGAAAPTSQEAVHHALIAMAGIFSTTIDYTMFGIDSTKWGVDTVDQRWGTKGIARKSFPVLFPGNRTESGIEALGKDRPVHWVHHALITYELLYCKDRRLPTIDKVPFGIGLLTDYGMRLNPQVAASVFSSVIGHVYETKTTFDHFPRNLPLIGNSREAIFEGLGDPEVQHDLAANELGALSGLALYNGHVREVVALLDRDELVKQTDSPRIPTDIVRELSRLAYV